MTIANYMVKSRSLPPQPKVVNLLPTGQCFSDCSLHSAIQILSVGRGGQKIVAAQQATGHYPGKQRVYCAFYATVVVAGIDMAKLDWALPSLEELVTVGAKR